MGIISEFLVNPCINWQISFAFSILTHLELHFEVKTSRCWHMTVASGFGIKSSARRRPARPSAMLGWQR